MHLGELLKWPLMSVTSLLGHSAVPPQSVRSSSWQCRWQLEGEGSSLATRGMWLHSGALWNQCLHLSEAVLGSSGLSAA